MSLRILIIEKKNESNRYIEELANEYKSRGHAVFMSPSLFWMQVGRFDVVHFHWLEALFYWRTSLGLDHGILCSFEDRLIKLIEDQSTKLIVTYHNQTPHNGDNKFLRSAYKLVYKYADYIINHGPESIIINQREYATNLSKHVILPHGPILPLVRVKKDIMQEYCVQHGSNIVLYYGRARKNKDAKFAAKLIERMVRINNKYSGLIVQRSALFSFQGLFGRFFFSLPHKCKIKKVIAIFSRGRGLIVRHNTNITHSDVDDLLSACTCVVVANKDGLNSGIISQAISYGRAVIYPNIGNYRYQCGAYTWAIPYEIEENVEDICEKTIKILEKKHLMRGRTDYSYREWIQASSWLSHSVFIEKICNSK